MTWDTTVLDACLNAVGKDMPAADRAVIVEALRRHVADLRQDLASAEAEVEFLKASPSTIARQALLAQLADVGTPNWFLRCGPRGDVVGPFRSRRAATAWLKKHGYDLDHEGATWKLYEATRPEDARG